MVAFRGLSFLKEDREFIRIQLSNISKEAQIYFIEQYNYHWLASFNAEPAEHKKDNAGRRAANIYLLTAIEDFKMARSTIEYEVIHSCSNCEHLDLENNCVKHETKVPDDYIAVETECELYRMGVPL